VRAGVAATGFVRLGSVAGLGRVAATTGFDATGVALDTRAGGRGSARGGCDVTRRGSVRAWRAFPCRLVCSFRGGDRLTASLAGAPTNRTRTSSRSSASAPPAPMGKGTHNSAAWNTADPNRQYRRRRTSSSAIRGRSERTGPDGSGNERGYGLSADGETPSLLGEHGCVVSSGRSPGSWAGRVDRLAAFPFLRGEQWHPGKGSHLQWRDRTGFKPVSLLSPKGPEDRAAGRAAPELVSCPVHSKEPDRTLGYVVARGDLVKTESLPDERGSGPGGAYPTPAAFMSSM